MLTVISSTPLLPLITQIEAEIPRIQVCSRNTLLDVQFEAPARHDIPIYFYHLAYAVETKLLQNDHIIMITSEQFYCL